MLSGTAVMAPHHSKVHENVYHMSCGGCNRFMHLPQHAAVHASCCMAQSSPDMHNVAGHCGCNSQAALSCTNRLRNIVAMHGHMPRAVTRDL